MNFTSVHDLLVTAFFFGMAAGLLISYLMVAVVWKFAVAVKVGEMADRIAEKCRQEAELRLNEEHIAAGRARLEHFARVDAKAKLAVRE